MATSCTICHEPQSVMHYHHTIPRSRGGDNSLQIPLCSDCHNQLHANAVAIVAKLNGRKKPLKRFWKNQEQEDTAQPYLIILVKAIMSPPVGEREHLVSASVSTSLFEEFKFLQQDLGLSSMEKALEYCINYTLVQKGIKNVLSKTSKTKNDLWFM